VLFGRASGLRGVLRLVGVLARGVGGLLRRVRVLFGGLGSLLGVLALLGKK